MIRDLSETLEKILTHPGLPAELKGARILFDRPTETGFPPDGHTAVDLFLYDIRENVDLRGNQPEIIRNNGQVTTRKPPLRVACSYLVTAWPVGGTDLALQEHRLLSQVLQVLSSLPIIPPNFLQGSLAGQQPPLPMLTALVDPQKNLSEFWTALGSKLRPSLTVKVTISLADVLAPETAPMVLTERIQLGERASPDVEEILSGTLDEGFLIGGSVTDAANHPVPAATVTLVEIGRTSTTTRDGRFVLGRTTAGAFTLRVKANATRQDFAINVPAPKGRNYNVQLT